MEVGENWDFREAILDLRDRYLYKITPFMAAHKFKTIMQGNHDAQALYDDLSTQAARMVEYPSDYHFRLRFMLALRPEVLDYIIKSHSMSAENSTLTQIRSACVDFERSYKYGKQVSATQARLGGPRPPHAHNDSRNRSHIRNDTRAPLHSQHAHSNSNANKSQSAMARLSGEGSSKNLPTRTMPKHDLKAKPAHQHEQKTNVKKVSCFNCGGLHYTRDCPPENQKAARGYAACIADEDAMRPWGMMLPSIIPHSLMAIQRTIRHPSPMNRTWVANVLITLRANSTIQTMLESTISTLRVTQSPYTRGLRE